MSTGTFIQHLAETTNRPELVRSAIALWVVLALVGLILVVILLLLASSRHRRRLRGPPGRRRGRGHVVQVDAWTEAGRRVQPEPADEATDLDKGLNGNEPGEETRN